MLAILVGLGLLQLCAGTGITMRNNCGYTVWAAMYGRTKSAGTNYIPPNGGGWELRPGQSVHIDVPDDLVAGRWWGRTGCRNDGGRFHCETGDCGWLDCGNHHSTGVPPATLAEITLNSPTDFYDVSLVDGFNIPMTLKPVGAAPGGEYWCRECFCRQDLNQICPNELKQIVNGRTVGCKSACLAFNTDLYCCRGAHDRPETCNPQTWPHDYHRFFKDHCHTAYSYAYDDRTSTFQCQHTAYEIDFCS